MKIIGKIDIGVDIYQIDRINSSDFSFKAKKGSFIFDSLNTVFEKNGPKDTDWIRSTFRVMMMNILTWGITLLESEEEDRKDVVKLITESIRCFKGGEPSDEGQEAVDFLKRECKLIGFAPSITYIMHRPRGEGSLNVFWEHPFSMPTLLYKHNDLPFLILSNGNIDFDDSRLRKMTKISKIHVDNLPTDALIEEEHEEVSGITG